eukprot:jgi/Tetstr1/422966/TSEL_013744.t1
MAAAKEMRHWNPEAHIGDDEYILADVKAAVAEATAGTTDEQERFGDFKGASLGAPRQATWVRVCETARTMTAAKEMRHWNPEAHIGDDGYVLADVKAAVAEATTGTTDEQEVRRVERSN